MKKPADVELVFLRSIHVTLSAAALVMADAEGALWPAAFTPFFALLTYHFVDRKKRLRLNVRGANIMGVLAFAAMIYEFRGGTLLDKLLSGAHLLVYMSWVVLFLRKGIRQFWWLAALSMLQISVASVLTSDPRFGLSLVGMLLLMIWTLSVFTLYRTRVRLAISSDGIEDSLNDERSGMGSSIIVKNGLQIDADEHWIGWRFRGIVSFAFAASLVVACIAFVVFPRVWVQGSTLTNVDPVAQGALHQTGFTDTVQLGEIGQIMQSNARVLQFSITRMVNREPVTAETFAREMNMDEILFRGTVLGHYQSGRWTNHRIVEQRDTGFRKHYLTRTGDSDYRINITQDGPIGVYAFAPLPVTNAVSLEGTRSIHQRLLSRSLIHHLHDDRPRSEPLSYEVWCRRPRATERLHRPDQLNLLESFVENMLKNFDEADYRDWSVILSPRFTRATCITPNLKESLPKLTEQAQSVCTDDNGIVVQSRECVSRILAYLTSDQFEYSLNATVMNADLDPIEDFLINRRSGHCEYFASACALMLQAMDIPARVVNGYKGSDVNTVSGRAEVRQKHAHTWVEVFIDDHWETVDPTPASARGSAVGQSTGLDWWTDLKLSFNDSWYGIVQKMSLQRQEALIRPVVDWFKRVARTIREQGVWEALKMFYREVLLKPEKWISVQGWIVTFVLLLGASLLFRSRFFERIRRTISRILSWLSTDSGSQKSVIRFYESFRNLCQNHGLRFPDSSTAIENARMATTHFRDVLVTAEDRQLPVRIASTFNDVRFGQADLEPAAVEQVRADVMRLGELISGKTRPATAAS